MMPIGIEELGKIDMRKRVTTRKSVRTLLAKVEKILKRCAAQQDCWQCLYETECKAKWDELCDKTPIERREKWPNL